MRELIDGRSSSARVKDSVPGMHLDASAAAAADAVAAYAGGSKIGAFGSKLHRKRSSVSPSTLRVRVSLIICSFQAPSIMKKCSVAILAQAVLPEGLEQTSRLRKVNLQSITCSTE